MCLAVPRQVIKVRDNKALLQDKRWVLLDLVPKVRPGDYVIVSADLAVEKITKKQAKDMNEAMESI